MRVRGWWVGAVLVLLSGCQAVISIPDPAGVRIYPERRNQVLGPGEVVSISFDHRANRQSVEDIFLIEEATGRLAGSYRWESRRVDFVPEAPYVPGRRYVITFSGTFEDDRGVAYTVHHSTPFFFESATDTQLAVLSVDPPGGSTLGLTDSIAVTCSVAVDPATLLRSVSVMPQVEIARELDPGDRTGRTIVVRPRGRWKSFTVYTLRVSEELEDLEGRPLAADFTATFIAQEDPVAPTLLTAEAVANDPGSTPPFSGPGSEITAPGYELLPSDVFRFSFSEAMDRDAAEKALSFSPTVAGEKFWLDDDTFVFIPDRPLRPGITFTLLLDATAADRSGMPLVNPLAVELEATLEPLSVSVDLVEDGVTLSDSREGPPVSIHPGLSPDFTYNIALRFSAPFDTNADKLSLRRSVRLTPLLSNDFAWPFLVGYSWTTNREIRLTYHNVAPSRDGEMNYLLLSLPGGADGVTSTAGNDMDEDLRILLLPEAP